MSLLATSFPSRAGAVAAYTSDATFSWTCSRTPVLPLPLRSAMCTYLNPRGPQATLYGVATAGTVELDVVGYVAEASPAARERAGCVLSGRT